MSYNRHNFHRSTFCIFAEAEIPNRNPDYESRSGSRYWFSEKGVLRQSNHWGRAAKCKWRLVSTEGKTSRTKSGYANWSDFLPDNEHEKLYFLKYENAEVQFFHKNSDAYKGELCRTAAETMKRIRKMRQCIDDNQSSETFLKYLADTDLPIHEINRLLSTN